MADRPDGKPARTERVTFTRPAAERIASAVRKVEAGNRDSAPLTFGRGSPAVLARGIRVCTFTGVWSKGTSRAVNFINVTTTPNTAMAQNIFATVGASNQSRSCAIARDGAAWYLIAAEC